MNKIVFLIVATLVVFDINAVANAEDFVAGKLLIDNQTELECSS